MPLAERTDTDVDERIVRILSEPTPEVNVTALGDNSVGLQVLVWVDGLRGKRRVRDHVYRRALACFDEAGIEIPYPQRVVHLQGKFATNAENTNEIAY